MLQPGQKFEHFEVLRKLGEGGMGAVYLVRDEKLGRRVALKILPTELTADPERRERFRREARLAASISHPNVTAVHDFGASSDPETGDAVSYIVMEFVEGEPLQRYLDLYRPDVADSLRLAEKIAAGLAAAHKLGIVHRDVKPENVVVTGDGEPKILDFGLARPALAALQSSDDSDRDVTVAMKENLTQEGKVVGTVQYMSPEQAQGQPLDTRSDIFSFGILLYRLATGHAPFTGETQVSTLARIIERPHEPARALNPGVPATLEAIIDRCLEKSPDRRYQDTAELVEDLRNLRRQVESGVTESVSAVRPVRERSRSRLRLGLVAALVVVVGIAAVTYLQRGGNAPVADAGENNLAILNFENKTGDEELAWLATGLPEILLTDLAQVPGLSLVSRERVLDRIRTSSGKSPREASRTEWLDASRRLGASTVLSGSYFRLGDRIRIDARLEDVATGKILFADKVSGTDALALVDSLTALVTGELDLSAGDGRVAEITTASTEAYKFYHLGEEKFLLNLFDEARSLYRRAIEEDSTFALPYLRIGMTHVFENRMQEGIRYLEKALRYRDRLPARDRGVLAAYADVWVTQQYDEGYTKIRELLEEYPRDKEIRTIYAALVISFAADTAKGFAEYEQVLDADPTYPFALQLYAQDLNRFGRTEDAIRLLERMRKAYPEAPAPYNELGGYYAKLDQVDRAMGIYEEYLTRFPGDPEVIPMMVDLAIRMKDRARARALVEKIRIIRPGDVQWERMAEILEGGLDNWEGRFRSAMDHYHRALACSRDLGDSVLIAQSLGVIQTYHERYEHPDSAVFYAEASRPFARPLERIGYPVTMVQFHPERADEFRPVLREAVNDFKAHTPEAIWKMADSAVNLYDAFAARDTAALIDVYRERLQLPANMQGGFVGHDLGKILVLTGAYEEAMPLLEEARNTNNGWRYLDTTYWLGRAAEGTGDGDRAAELYREVLEHWGDADYGLEAIRGSRAGLERLSG